jgi:hypothetical protein
MDPAPVLNKKPYPNLLKGQNRTSTTSSHQHSPKVFQPKSVDLFFPSAQGFSGHPTIPMESAQEKEGRAKGLYKREGI